MTRNRAGGLPILLLCSGLLASVAPAAESSERVHVTAASDPAAIEIAQRTVAAMGGWERWDDVKYVRWDFFGGRRHYWNRTNDEVRIEIAGDDEEELLVLMNARTKSGRVWRNDAEITDPLELEQSLERAHQIWINDSYWMFMPFKLLDPGVTLSYAGERAMADNRPADVLGLTFGEGVGYTPNNRYEVFVARDTGLVEQWSFFADAAESEPRFTMPWAGWREFGGIKLATEHGREKDWKIALFDELPAVVFSSPAPVGE